MEPQTILALAKRRGFFFPSFEIYGGMAGMFDYGPLGSLMKANIESIWRSYYLVQEGCAEVTSPAVSPEDVFIASGHVAEFTDFSVQCRKCGDAFRADHLLEGKEDNPDGMSAKDLAGAMRRHNIRCPNCKGEITDPEPINLMFRTQVGPVGGRTGYLRPETAQAMFFNFNHYYRHFREKLPFGVIQLGRGYRNEISPRQGITRLREFNMMEAEVFFHPDDKNWPGWEGVKNNKLRLVPDGQAEVTLSLEEAAGRKIVANEPLAYFMNLTYEFMLRIGADPARLRFRQHEKTEMAHYATDCWDCEALTGYGWLELVGIADRGCYDLQSHIDHSGEELSAFIRFDEPREMEVTRILPKRNILGPRFKALAGRIADMLEEIDGSTVAPDATIELEIDGQQIAVGPDCFDVSTMVEKVSGERVVPHVVEPSYGLDRIFYVVMEHSYNITRSDEGDYVTLRLPPAVAPYKFGVFPLMAKDGLDDMASGIRDELRSAGILTYYDSAGAIGRRYARMDEAGTPFCITVDYEAMEGQGVTIRERDTKDQKRVRTEDLILVATGLVSGGVSFSDLG